MTHTTTHGDRRCHRARLRRDGTRHTTSPGSTAARGGRAGHPLEQRGPAGHRPARTERRLRHGELRQQVPRRRGGLHGHRPRRDLRRGAGDRRRLRAVCDRHRGAARHVGGRRGGDGGAPHPDRAATGARADARAAGRPRRALRRLPGRDSGRRARRPRGSRSEQRVAQAVLALRAGDGRERNPQLEDLDPPPPGPGVWSSGGGAALGSAAAGHEAAGARERVAVPPRRTAAAEQQGATRSTSRRSRRSAASTAPRGGRIKTAQALFWTDHDLRQWNDGMLALAADARLGLVETARMLALAHVAGGDAMIACFDAKYSYWFWRPFQAIPQADTDDNDADGADPEWQPLRPTPAHPEYPSAHACHTTAVAEALQAFFGPRRVAFTLDSRATGTTHHFRELRRGDPRRQRRAGPGRLPLPPLRRGRIGAGPTGRALRGAASVPPARLGSARGARAAC